VPNRRQRVCGVVFVVASSVAIFGVLALGAASAAESSAAKVKVTIVKKGPGMVSDRSGSIVCGTRCSAWLDRGTLAGLTADGEGDSTFSGWSGACVGEVARCTLYLNGNASATAHFEAGYVNLDVVVGGAGRVTSTPRGITCGMGADDCSQAVLQGSTVRLQADPALTSAFAGWGGACSGDGVCKVSLRESRSVRAVFRRVYAVSASASGSGTIDSDLWPGCDLPCSSVSPSNAVVPLVAVPSPDQVFEGWSGSCVGAAASCALATDTPSTVTASFVSEKPVLPGVGPPLEVTVAGLGTVTGGGIECSPICAARPGVPVVVLSAVAQSGSVFDGWGGDCTGAASTCTVGLAAARSVTATFRRLYSLEVRPHGGRTSVRIDPPAISCGTCSVPERSDASVTVSVVPQNSTANWGRACTGDTPVCTLAVDAPTVIPLSTRTVSTKTAVIVEAYGLIVSLTEKGTVKESGGFRCVRKSGPKACSENLKHDASVQLTAEPSTRFLQWSGSCTGKRSSCSLSMSETRTVIAHFRKP
jgi:hypothetical protein